MIAVTAGCLLVGATAALGAGLGLLRLPDLLTRMHAATKPQAVGLLLVLVAVGTHFPTGEVITTLVLVAALQIVTVPIAAHMVGRAAYRSGQVDPDRLYTDELSAALGPGLRDGDGPPDGDGMRDGDEE